MFVLSGTFTSATNCILSQRATVVPSAFVTCASGWVGVVTVPVASGVASVEVAAVSAGREGVGVKTAAVNVN
jgi:hypothetical protein